MNAIRFLASITRTKTFLTNGMVKHFKDNHCMRFPTFGAHNHEGLLKKEDYCRYTTLGLALQRVLSENIPGSLAEAGVYRGNTSKFIHAVAPDRPLYLFDTFKGFSKKDLSAGQVDERFKDTDVEHVLHNIGDRKNIIIKKGYVPETFEGLDGEEFSFVLLDLDVYNPMIASLEFFYPRMSRGGYIVVHDYNNDESDWACKRGVDEFLKDKPELVIEIADVWGSVLFRKI